MAEVEIGIAEEDGQQTARFIRSPYTPRYVVKKAVRKALRTLISRSLALEEPLTFWRRNYFFNFSTYIYVYKMQIIQEPGTLEL